MVTLIQQPAKSHGLQTSEPKMETESNEYRRTRIEKAEAIRALGINPYPYRYDKTHNAVDIQSKYGVLENGQETEDEVSVAGRIMSIRNNGMFIDLHDVTGKVQIFSHQDNLSEEQQKLLSLLDLGDLIGVKGQVRKTPRGEVTINSSQITLLCKSLLPLPDKYHGLTDIELRYRQRYLDLIMSPESRETLRIRNRIVLEIRNFLVSREFLEVETPMLHPIPGGASAKPFETHHNALDMQLFLRIAPELYLKRLVVGGLSERVFEINRSFRNEGISTRHNPEFTMMELYQAFADYKDMMELTETMVETVAMKVLGTTTVNFDGQEINFKGPWKRASMTDLVRDATGVDMLAIEELVAAKEAAKSVGVNADDCINWGQVVEEIFAEKVEKTLIQPIHVTDLPLDISPLAKVHRDNPRLTERFETFVNTWEIANAFSELSDPLDQRARFESQVAAREAGDEEAQHLDEDYLTALEYGLPPTGGLGIGIDRLAMLLTDSQSIRDVIAFPTMRQK